MIYLFKKKHLALCLLVFALGTIKNVKSMVKNHLIHRTQGQSFAEEKLPLTSAYRPEKQSERLNFQDYFFPILELDWKILSFVSRVNFDYSILELLSKRTLGFTFENKTSFTLCQKVNKAPELCRLGYTPRVIQPNEKVNIFYRSPLKLPDKTSILLVYSYQKPDTQEGEVEGFFVIILTFDTTEGIFSTIRNARTKVQFINAETAQALETGTLLEEYFREMQDERISSPSVIYDPTGSFLLVTKILPVKPRFGPTERFSIELPCEILNVVFAPVPDFTLRRPSVSTGCAAGNFALTSTSMLAEE